MKDPRRTAAARTGQLFAKGGEDLPLFAEREKQGEKDRIRRTKAEIDRLRAALKLAQVEYDERAKATERRITQLEAMGKTHKLAFATKAEQKKEAARIERIRYELRTLKEAYSVATKEHDARVVATRKRIAELDASLRTGAHKIGPSLSVFGIEIDPKHR